MGRHNSNYFRNLGLTNHQSEDLSAYAYGRNRDVSFAFCCQEVIRDVNRDICPKCENYLKWNSCSPSLADKMIHEFNFNNKRNAILAEEYRKEKMLDEMYCRINVTRRDK